jgi:septum formation protein
MRIVLASQSPYRQAQLRDFGLAFETAPPAVDEEALKRSGPADPVELTRFLALKKAESLRAAYPDALIVGGDQMAEFNGERLDKPGTAARAIEQLRRLSGHEHRLITALALVSARGNWVDVEITRLSLRPLDEETIRAYIAHDRPLDCAGSYKVEKAGLSLIESVSGRDPSAVQGLPLILLTRGLAHFGFSPAEFWRPA